MFDGSFRTNCHEINLAGRSTPGSKNRESHLREARERRLARVAATAAARLNAACVLQRCWRGVRWHFARGAAKATTNATCGTEINESNIVEDLGMDASKLDVKYKSEELGYSSKTFANHVTPEKDKSEGMEDCKPIANSDCKQCSYKGHSGMCVSIYFNFILLFYSSFDASTSNITREFT
jgi:hypothetical protein